MVPTSRRSSSSALRRVAILVAALVASNVAGADLLFAQPKGAAPADPSEANVKKGIDLYKKGQTLLGSKKFDEALAAFRESNNLLPSPNTRLLMARCLVGLQKNVEAYNEFEGVIADAKVRNDPKYDQAVTAANTERDELTPKIALVIVNVSNASAGTRVAVGGKDIPADSWGKPIPFDPGSVDVSITTPPAPSQTQVLDLKPGNKRLVSLDAAGQSAGPAPTTTATSSSGPAPRWMRPASYAALGVGVAGMAVFGVGGVLANSAYSELNDKCAKTTGTRACPNNIAGKIDEGKNAALAANVGVIVGGVGLAAGVTLFILSRRGGSAPKEEAPKVAPIIAPGYLGVQGTF